MQAVKPPIAFAVANVRVVTKFPNNDDMLWAADVKACRHGVQMRLFEGVMFVESDDVAYVYGLEAEDGRPPGLADAMADVQQKFVEFLREENRNDRGALGELASLFHGSEYACEAKVTAAYIAQRGEPLHMGIGYRNNDGAYEMIRLDLEQDDWLERARNTLSFDEIDR
jgi:hypothetical protein